jgi:hypothetical protein
MSDEMAYSPPPRRELPEAPKNFGILLIGVMLCIVGAVLINQGIDAAKIVGYRMVLSEYQNHYPDISFIAPDETRIALDLKSTYRVDAETVNGFTLGAFTGYIRQRKVTKNITFPYEQYDAHFVLGIIYSRSDEAVDERRVYALNELQNIVSVVKDFTFLLQEKWRIASDRPGSGNTKNIGSARDVQVLVEGNGPFAPHGFEVFDDYWMNYLTEDMARAIDSDVPYHNLQEYWKWRNRVALTR